MYSQEILSPGYDSSKIFLPAGDGARYIYRSFSPTVTAEVRVRRDGLVSSARNEVELYSEEHQRLWLCRPNLSDAVLVEVPEGQRGANLTGEARREAELANTLLVPRWCTESRPRVSGLWKGSPRASSGRKGGASHGKKHDEKAEDDKTKKTKKAKKKKKAEYSYQDLKP